MNLAKQNMFICSTPEDNQVTSNKRKLEETSLEQEIDTILNKPRNKRKRKKRRKDKKITHCNLALADLKLIRNLAPMIAQPGNLLERG